MTKLAAAAASIGDLWKSSALIQGALALMFGATVCYLSIVGRDVPGVLLALIGTIIGFYFGTKNRIKE